MKLSAFNPKRYRRRIFSQLWMLALQFILGMILNFIGSDGTGVTHTVYVVVLVAHILNAIGLVEGAIYIVLKQPSQVAWRAAVALSVTFIAGVLTVITGSDIWSFVMAAGFLGSFWLNGMLYLEADRQLHGSNLSG